MAGDWQIETSIIPRNPASDAGRQMLGLFDAPAFVRRAVRMQAEIDKLYRRCERQREDWLDAVRLRLRAWRCCRPDDWRQPFLEPLLKAVSCEQWEHRGKPATSHRTWSELYHSVLRFNTRWSKFISIIDLGPVNDLIDGYHRNYILEKECAFRSPVAARIGFIDVPPITTQALLERYPLLPEPPASPI